MLPSGCFNKSSGHSVCCSTHVLAGVRHQSSRILGPLHCNFLPQFNFLQILIIINNTSNTLRICSTCACSSSSLFCGCCHRKIFIFQATNPADLISIYIYFALWSLFLFRTFFLLPSIKDSVTEQEGWEKSAEWKKNQTSVIIWPLFCEACYKHVWVYAHDTLDPTRHVCFLSFSLCVHHMTLPEPANWPWCADLVKATSNP